MPLQERNWLRDDSKIARQVGLLQSKNDPTIWLCA